MGVLNPSFAKNNEIKKSGWKPYTGEKKEVTKLVFSPSLELHLQVWICLPSLLLLISFFQSSLVVTIQSCRILWTATQFCMLVPSFAHFPPILKLGMEQGSHGQARAQTQGDFKDDSNSCHASLVCFLKSTHSDHEF